MENTDIGLAGITVAACRSQRDPRLHSNAMFNDALNALLGLWRTRRFPGCRRCVAKSLPV